MACFVLTVGSQAGAGVIKSLVFESGEEGYNIYRIPTIIQAANTDLLAFAEGRVGGDASEIDIVMKRSQNGGQSWGDLHVVKDSEQFRSFFSGTAPPITVGNQTPVVDRLDPNHPGRIWMGFTLENDRVFSTYSDDHGATWSNHVEITPSVKDPSWGWYATGPVHGIQLTRGRHAGRLILPSDHRVAGVTSWGSHVAYSDDHGQTWRLGAVDTHVGSGTVNPNENVAVELVDGRLYFNARNQNGAGNSNRAIAYSDDGGETYVAPFTTEPQIVSPVVQNSSVRVFATDLGDAENLLLHSGPGQPHARRDLTIRVSNDEGSTWTNATVIHAGPAAYSDLVKIQGGKVGVLYEAGDSLYEEILFGYFDVADLNPAAWNGIDGDVNQDGSLDAADVDAFVRNWTPVTNEFYLGGVDSYTNDDLNFDGLNDLYDVHVMRTAIRAAGLDGSPLESLFIPEPGIEVTVMWIAGAVCIFRSKRLRLARTSNETE